MLQDPGKFLDMLFQYDKDNIPDAVISKIQPYIDNDDFQPANIAKVLMIFVHLALLLHTSYLLLHTCQVKVSSSYV